MAPQSASASPSPAAFAPRLFDPDLAPEPPDDPQHWTMRRAFEKLLAADYKPSQRGTIEGFSRTLALWEELTENPSLPAISTDILKAFCAALEGRFSISTVAKHCRYVRQILRRCVEEGHLPRIPRFKSPKVGRPKPHPLSRDQVDRLYLAAAIAVWPELPEVAAPDWWRALLAGLYNLGPRIQEILCDGADPRMGWLWENYKPYMRLADGTQLWSISFRSSKTGNHLLLPVAPLLQVHLERIRTDRRAMFPITRDHGTFYDKLDLLKVRAEVPLGPKTGPHAIRGTCQTEWDLVNPLFGNFVLDHAEASVAAHYRLVATQVAEASPRLPQPPSFISIHDRPPRERQAHLA